jgi:hypothetical protein
MASTSGLGTDIMDILGTAKISWRASGATDATLPVSAEAVQEAATTSAAPSQTALSGLSLAATTQTTTRNPLENNFVTVATGQSSYIAATLNAFTIADQLQNSKTNQLFSALDQFGGIADPQIYEPGQASAGGTGGSEAYIKMLLKRQGGKKIMEQAAEEFQKERDAAEQKAQDAADPTKTQPGDTPATDGATACGSEPATATPATADAPAGAVATAPAGPEPSTASADPAAAAQGADTPSPAPATAAPATQASATQDGAASPSTDASQTAATAPGDIPQGAAAWPTPAPPADHTPLDILV